MANRRKRPVRAPREGMTREQMKRYNAYRRRRILRRRRKIFLMFAALALVLVFLFILKLSGFFEERSTVTTFRLNGDGTVTFEEIANVDGASGDEVRAFIKDSIRTYNKENGRGSIRLERFAEKDGNVYVRTSYRDTSVYAGFTGLKCFAGTIDEAIKAGYDLSDVYVKVENAKKGSSVNVEEALSDKRRNVLAIEQNLRVLLPGTLLYITDAATTAGDDGVTINTGDDKTVVMTYMIYNTAEPEKETKK